MMNIVAQSGRILLALLLFFGAPVQARVTEISPGVLYPAGAALSASELGVEFTVPQGWQAMLPQGTEIMIMEPKNAIARILLSAVPDSSESSLKQLMTRNQPLDMNSQLVPVGGVAKKGKFYHQRYSIQGFNPQNLAAQAFAVIGDNQAAFVAVILEPKDKEQYTDMVRNLVASVRFSVPQQALAQQSANDNIDWERELSGRTLKYMRTSDGLSETRKINLCSNHTFSYSDSDNYASSDVYTDFSASTSSGQKGRWQITGNRLILRWSDGSQTDHILSRRYVEDWDEWGTFVDDERWFRERNRACY